MKVEVTEKFSARLPGVRTVQHFAVGDVLEGGAAQTALDLKCGRKVAPAKAEPPPSGGAKGEQGGKA